MELREKLSKQLEGFPSLKKHESDIRKIVKTSSDIEHAIRKELDVFLYEDSPRSKLEEIRAYDMLSFMYNIYGDEENTKKYIEKALDIDPSNIITLTCKAHFFLDKEERLIEVKDIIHEVNTAMEKQYRVIQADAEIAYAFSRCGMKMYSKAIARFESVIENASRITDANQPLEWTTHVCIWTFGLALTKRRLLHPCNTIDPVEMSEYLKAHGSVIDLLKDVTNISIKTATGINKVIQLYRARALVEIGVLVDSVQRNKKVFRRGLSDIIPDCDTDTSARHYIDAARAICNNDVFVLQKCGKMYRYIQEIDLSIELLQKAVAIKPSSFGLHHLALSLKRCLEMKSPEWNHRRGRGRGRHVRQLHYGNSRERDTYTAEPCQQEPKINRSVSRGSGNEDSGFVSMSFLPHQHERRLQQQSQFSDAQQLEEQLDSLKLEPSKLCAATEVSCTKIKSPEWNHSRGRGRGRHERQLHDGHSRKRDTYTAGPCRQEPQINRSVSLGSGNEDSGFASMSLLHHQNERRLQQQSQYSDAQQLEEQPDSLKLEPSKLCAATGVSCTESQVNTVSHTLTGLQKSSSNERFYSSSNRRGRGRHGRRVRQPFRRCISELPRNRSFENMIKSPKKVMLIDTNLDSKKTIDAVLDNLDKAIELNNTAALYDKGLFLRQIKDSDQAYDIFKKVIKDERCSLVLLANSYEQAAYCILDKNNKSEEFQMQYYLKRSVEVSCNLVAKIPFLKNCWQAAPTLLDFLNRKAKTTETLRNLGFLYDKMENFQNAIDVYEELLQKLEETGEKIEILTEMIKTFISLGRYDDAVLAFDTIMCLPDGRAQIDEDLYIDVHIEGGLQSLIKEEHAMAQLRLKNAIQFNANTNEDSEETEEARHDENDVIGQKFDIYILCDDEKAEEKFMNLFANLKTLGLSVTLNEIDVPPGQTTMEGISYAMEASHHFIIALEAKPTRTFQHRVAMINQILHERKHGNMIILAPPNFELPKWLYGSKVINSDVEFDKDADVQRILNNASLRYKLKEIISTLSRHREAS
ncbi:uncharacterized protein LOC127870942 isoform X1 [Dreissena polymorpha]|uniref:uncharacterized protein LOC127870942 isoform X1 n=1 Tax=Dreissena polymorpha TaxID=45954 RepID=UPI00226423C3|nr:uncharacterized protein LOC127870942 isoform X1 [Dreissena polymorpha]XP_052269491.1 uncharacterized protein LOC127870942 isoform X1 [Dreissena polymorpha]XP_052269492.1 uncharacterized protein LOC127870942 isoform X1 [Dreissena polymorpha]XP_052269493.1 uncharacterized protein LOC127870942 isoform X1 [Dreissena polymorpha]